MRHRALLCFHSVSDPGASSQNGWGFREVCCYESGAMGNVCVPNAQEQVRVQQGLPTCRPARGCLRPLAEKRVQGIPGLIGPKYSDTGKMEPRGQGGLCLLLGSF